MPSSIAALPSLARAAGCLVLAAACPLAAHAAADDARVRAVVDAAVRPLMASHDIPGMAVAVTVDGRRYVFTYGVASKESRAPVTETTLFEIGSVSKTLTATLAAYAQATGQLSLDDHPGQYLPELKGRPIDQATLLHLGTYTAGGLPLQFPDPVEGDAAAMAYFRDWQPRAAPGTRRQYSNPSLGLFGRVAGIALKDGFAKAMETTVFPAFGMRHSHLQVPRRAMADYAWGYRQDKAVRVNPGPLDLETYGVKTTAADLLSFVQANIDPSALDAPMRRAVEATQVGHFRVGPMVQGLGWEQYAYPVSREWLLGGNSPEIIFESQPVHQLAAGEWGGARLFNKTGSTGGFGAYVAFVPSKQIGIVMLANRSYPIPARVEVGLAILNGLTPKVE
ncbi:class C beta-lactamase [Roseateles aquatilis]|uniref:Beta-lactamase n=1 Tax=Roseateles aquatilis TaxID=431061 RepID=A0A246IV93_9BURK|nr:class C beta-lactamase [Roseateles aquatilis]OWQ84132.1 class C beta-lactamase [Roseateles aquatilis]